MHPFLLTLIHLAIATGGLLLGCFVTAVVASQSSMRGAGYALWVFAAVGVIGLIALGVSFLIGLISDTGHLHLRVSPHIQMGPMGK